MATPVEFCRKVVGRGPDRFLSRPVVPAGVAGVGNAADVGVEVEVSHQLVAVAGVVEAPHI